MKLCATSFLAAGTAVVLVACAQSPTSAPGLEAGDPTATIKLIRAYPIRARVLALDGHEVKGGEFLVAPGKHSAWVRTEGQTSHGSGTLTVWTNCKVTFIAEAGRTYLLKPIWRKKPEGRGSVVSVASWAVDEETGEMVGRFDCQASEPDAATLEAERSH